MGDQWRVRFGELKHFGLLFYFLVGFHGFIGLSSSEDGGSFQELFIWLDGPLARSVRHLSGIVRVEVSARA